MFDIQRPKRLLLAALSISFLLGGVLLSQASAGPADLASVPVVGTGAAAPKPNLMLLMDTSRSMAFTHMPDELEGNNLVLSIGYRSSQCNSLYYDPAKKYDLPKDAGGTLQPMNDLTFFGARYNFYSTDLTNVDLSTSFRAYDKNTRQISIETTGEDKAQPAYYYQFIPTSGTAGPLDYRTSPCTNLESTLFPTADFTQPVLNAGTTGGTWRRKLVTSTSGVGNVDERKNFAIWYTYYRTRMAMVKSSISLAFFPVTDKFRVGLVSMNPLNDSTSSTSGVNASKYLAIDAFTPGQKLAWYSKLFQQVPEGSSPAREGLARVGRHFAGKMDGINTGMSPDPVTNSCQQNFTIMTTDGYWNTAAETVGPVGLDGVTKVGNMDGILTPKATLDFATPTLYSHRPMWDGTTSGKRTDTDVLEQKRYATCNTGQFYKKTSLVRQATVQTLQRTQALTVGTSQTLMSTAQTLMATRQTQRTVTTQTQQTRQNLASTQQQTLSTRQELRTRQWYSSGTSTIERRTLQNLQTTRYVEKYAYRRQSREVRITMTQTRVSQTQTQLQQTTTQPTYSTSQRRAFENRYYKTTTQPIKTTTQTFATTTRRFERTSQLLRYDGATETSTPVGSCTSGGRYTCITLVSGPTPVASCSPQTADGTNNYLARTCDTPVVSAATPVGVCTDTGATSGNNYTSTACNTVTTGPSPASSCATSGPTSGNSFTSTSCSTTTTPSTQVVSCTPGTDANFVTTSCSTVTGPATPVASCAQITNSATMVTTTCDTVTSGPTPIASCNPSGANPGNNYTVTTCNTVTTPATGVASCSPGTNSSTFVTTACNNVTTQATTRVTSCTPGTSATFVVTACTTEQIATNQPVASCTNTGASSANSYVKTVCTTTNGSYSDNANCSAVPAGSGNNYVAVECRDVVVTAATPVQPAACPGATSGGTTTTSSGVSTTCTLREFLNVPVSSCVANAAGPSVVTCSQATTGPTRVASCTQGVDTTTWVQTTCTPVTLTPDNNVQSCTYQAPTSGNGNVTTNCTPHTETLGVPPGSCSPQSPNALNQWVTVSCPAAVTTGPTGVPLGSCTSVAPSSANMYVATNCNTVGPTTPAPVATCTSGTSADFTVTTCTTNNSAVTRVMPGSCTPANASSTNQYTATVCGGGSTTTPVAAGNCTPVTPTSGNSYQQTTCNDVTTPMTPVALGSCTAGTDGNFMTTTCSEPRTGPVAVDPATCTAGTDGSMKVTTCNKVEPPVQQLAFGSACTSRAPTSGNSWTTTTCSSSDTEKGVGSCTPSLPGALPVLTCRTVTTPPTAVASCSNGTDANFLQSTCSPEETTERTTSCTPATAGAGNGFVGTTCAPVPGNKIQVKTQTLTTTYTVSGPNTVDGTGVAGTPTETGWTDVAGGACYAENVGLPSVDITPEWKRATTGMPSGCTAYPCAGTVDPSSAVIGSSNSLADVAQYYYVTDLRESTGANPDPGKNDVPRIGSGIEDDRAPWQHMTTFVVGLGVSGTLDYRADYKAGTGDFARIRSYENTPALNWPKWPLDGTMDTLAYNDPRSIDDFWHTAVNGRGKFFSAKDPQSVVDGLKEALAGIEAQAGAGAGASTSTLTPVQGDNTAYTGEFTSSDWTGELKAQDIDVTTGALSSTVKWSASTKLDLATGPACDNRKIFTRDPSTGTKVDFTWDSALCGTNNVPVSPTSSLPDSLKKYFDVRVKATVKTNLSQFATAGGTDAQLDDALGAKLVNFLRGQRGNEGFVAGTDGKLFRTRKHVLGDIVNSQPAYVKAPNLSYQDTGYDAFKVANAARTPMVYVGGNDGMLHAFYAPTKSTDPNLAKAGEEAWAYVPTTVMPSLYKLADTNYSEKHIYTVDGSPTTGDIYDKVSKTWKSVLVGGLNSGGKGYYALDITDPAAPNTMWEFNAATACSGSPTGLTSDCNLGLTFGRPVITKLKDGTWVVMVTSGYNNHVSPGDGGGYLYVLNALNGQIISRIATNTGNATTPSNLKDLNFFVSNIAYDNTAQRVYGGDMLGNIWRFDINDILPPAGLEAILIGTTVDKSGNPQPITTRPELAEVSGSTMVFVATGRLLSTADLTDTRGQSVYGIKDPLSATSPTYANLRASLKPLVLAQTGSGANATRTVKCASNQVTECSDTNGWVIDLPDSGERVNVDMQTVLGTLVFATNVPSDTMCVAGGYSWLNYVNLINGEAVASSPNGVVSVPFFNNSLVVGMGLIGLSDGKVKALGRDATGDTKALDVPVGSPPPMGKRISWREITQ